jgi:alpha,alpha-trehalase
MHGARSRRSMLDCTTLADTKIATRTGPLAAAGFCGAAGGRSLSGRKGADVRCGAAAGRRSDGWVESVDLPVAGPAVPARILTWSPAGASTRCMGGTATSSLLGLLESGRVDHGARHGGELLLRDCEHYGGLLNANRTYYLTRSQPPFSVVGDSRGVVRPKSRRENNGRRAPGWSPATDTRCGITRCGRAEAASRQATRAWRATSTSAMARSPRWPTTTPTTKT